MLRVLCMRIAFPLTLTGEKLRPRRPYTPPIAESANPSMTRRRGELRVFPSVRPTQGESREYGDGHDILMHSKRPALHQVRKAGYEERSAVPTIAALC